MILEEITLGQTEESKKDTVQKNLGQQVILNDDHNGWCHGVLLTERYNNEVYQMKIADGRRQRQLHYHNLNQILVIHNNPTYRRPDIK